MKEVFPLASSGNSALWVLIPVVVLLLALLILFASIGLLMRRGSVEVSSEGIRLEVPFYGRLVPMASLDLDGARPVDLTSEQDLRLKWRTNGIGLPRYNVGWFSLRNGAKALAAVTDPHKVLYVPTREGFSILVSVDEPARVREALLRSASPY